MCESQQLNWVIAVNPIINSTQWTAWVASFGYGLYIMLLLVLLALRMKNIIRATSRKHILWSTMNLTLNPFTYMDKDSQKWVKRTEQDNTTKDLERHNIYSNFKTSSSSFLFFSIKKKKKGKGEIFFRILLKWTYQNMHIFFSMI